MVTSLAASALVGPLVRASGAVPSLGPVWLEPQHVVASFGPWAVAGLCLFVFAETGLLVGFFLPGDTLLFSAGLLTATGAISTPLWLEVLALSLAAVAGGQLGFVIGRTAGRRLLERSRLVPPDQLDRTEAFLARHGSSAIILARFVAVVRTVAPVVAGAARMRARTYTVANVVGATLWVCLFTLTGGELGRVPAVRVFVLERLDEVVFAVVLLSVVLAATHLVRARREARRDARVGAAASPGPQPAPVAAATVPAATVPATPAAALPVQSGAGTRTGSSAHRHDRTA